MDIRSAKEKGAISLFDEKYENEVRVLSVDDFSIELCGGTHVDNTGFIGGFVIISESSVSSGVRRIEATTGSNVFDIVKSNRNILNEISSEIKASSTNEIVNKVKNLVLDIKKIKIVKY